MKKTALITGCSSGFGQLTAKKFHEKGWNVIATVRSKRKKVLLNDLENLEIIELDITDDIKIREVIDQIIHKYSAIDVLINNAGRESMGLFEQHNEEVTRYLFDINVFGTMNTTRAVLPYMRKQKSGTIVNVTSIRGIVGSPPFISLFFL